MALWWNGVYWHPNKVTSGEWERTLIFQGPVSSGPWDLNSTVHQLNLKEARGLESKSRSQPSLFCCVSESPETHFWEGWHERGRKWKVGLCVMRACALSISVNVSGLCVECVCVLCVCVWHVWKYLLGDSSPQSGTCMCRFHWWRQISGFQECLYLFPKYLGTVTKNPLKCLSFFPFWLCCVAHGILVPRQGIEPGSLSLEAWNLSPWTAREVSTLFLCSFLKPTCSRAVEFLLFSD